MEEKFCQNCGEHIPRKLKKDGSFSNYVKIYCSSNCSDSASKKKVKKSRSYYNKEDRRKEWEITKSQPQKLQKAIESNKNSRKKVTDWLSNYKLEKGCIDCGYKEYSCALQLDHQGFKSISIADARSSIDRLKKEIEDGQCVVRCANCHSVITWKRKVGST